MSGMTISSTTTQGAAACVKPKIFPACLKNRFNYQPCRVPMAVALAQFKEKYPEKHKDTPLDKTAHETYLRYQSAHDFWLTGKGEKTEVEIECHQEIQAIRAHLWEVILDDATAEMRESTDQLLMERVNEGSNFIISKAKVICAAILVFTIAANLFKFFKR